MNEPHDVPSINGGCHRAFSCPKGFFKRLATRKPIGLVLRETDTDNPFITGVTLIQMIGLGIGGIIGTGIFVLSGQGAALYAGPSIIISFIIAGIAAFLSALSFAELSALMSSSGSAYTYTYVALGEYPAFMIGWLSTLLYQLGSSAVAVRWSYFVVDLIDLLSEHNVTSSLVEAPIAWSEELVTFYATGQIINLPSVVITIAITVVLIIGIRETVIINLIFVIIKVIILLIFIFGGCVHVDRKNYDPFIPSNEGSFSQYGVTGMLHASTFVFFAYVGFETVTTVAQEAKEPARNTPRALIISLVTSILIYIGVCTVMVGLVPYKLLDTTYPIIEAAKSTPYGLWFPVLLDFGAIASLTTVAIIVLLAQTRIFYAMAYDGLLPRVFSRINNTTKTPWISILISGVICAVLSGICPLDIFGEVSSIAALITYLCVHICVTVMRYRCDIQRPFKVPCENWLIPLIGSLLCILLLISTSKGTAIRFGIWVGIGHIVYFSYGFWHSEARFRKTEELYSSTSDLVPPVYVISDASEADLKSEILEVEF